MATSSRGRKSSNSTRGGKSASFARGSNQAASGGPIDLPPDRAGTGDGQSWFDLSIQEAHRRRAEVRALHTQLAQHQPDRGLSARFMEP